MVGITGTKYKPLDNKYQIKEALDSLIKLINSTSDPYSKALITLAGISYIQPFEDGNKRVSRLVSNAILLSKNCAPLSYRNTDENEYKKAMLIFYEKNSLSFIKQIFVEQYLFSTKNYLVD
jgi:Fic family protein